MESMPWLTIPHNKRKGSLLMQHFNATNGDFVIYKGEKEILFKEKKWQTKRDSISNGLFKNFPNQNLRMAIGESAVDKKGKKIKPED